MSFAALPPAATCVASEAGRITSFHATEILSSAPPSPRAFAFLLTDAAPMCLLSLRFVHYSCSLAIIVNLPSLGWRQSVSALRHPDVSLGIYSIGNRARQLIASDCGLRQRCYSCTIRQTTGFAMSFSASTGSCLLPLAAADALGVSFTPSQL